MSPIDLRHRRRSPAKRLRAVRPIRGQVVDVSPLGLGLRSEDTLRVGQDYSFVLQHGWRRTRLEGKVKWCKLVGTKPERSRTVEPVYRLGIAVEELAPQTWQFLAGSLRRSSRSST